MLGPAVSYWQGNRDKSRAATKPRNESQSCLISLQCLSTPDLLQYMYLAEIIHFYVLSRSNYMNILEGNSTFLEEVYIVPGVCSQFR